MHFLAVISRKSSGFSEDQIAALLEPEAEYIRKGYTQGVFRSVFSRGDVKGAVIELECESADAAREILENLPMAAAGMLDMEIIPLLPYRGFAPRNP